jgi:hypothetical protein
MRPTQAELGGEPIMMVCSHWRVFPPVGAGGGMTPEQLRARKIIKEADYGRFLVWIRICNLTQMNPEKCLKCPHVRKADYDKGLPGLRTLDGTHFVPVIDLPTLEIRGRHRSHLKRRVAPLAGGGVVASTTILKDPKDPKP